MPVVYPARVPSARFLECLDGFTLLWETGRYTNHPKDPGGATRWGVIQRTYSAWLKQKGLRPRSVQGITREEVIGVYWDVVWLAGRCDLLPPPVDLAHFDNCTLFKRPTQILQACVDNEGDLLTDGVLGPVTFEAVLQWDPARLATLITAARFGYHVRSLDQATNRTFIEGWVDRAHDLLRVIQGGKSVRSIVPGK